MNDILDLYDIIVLLCYYVNISWIQHVEKFAGQTIFRKCHFSIYVSYLRFLVYVCVCVCVGVCVCVCVCVCVWCQSSSKDVSVYNYGLLTNSVSWSVHLLH